MCVSIRDTGCGIPEAIRDKIFDPFFTTKEPGVGTGLGLSLSFGLISKLGGTIECQSTVGEGTEFIVTFPCIAEAPSENEDDELEPSFAAERADGMKRDILYVDDEIENLIVFQATFEEHFNVVTANSGQEALDLLEARPFPVVIADQRMPRMTGAELFEIMRQRYPHTKRVMLTGYADSKAMLDSINQGQVFYFVKKPWEQDVVFSILVRAIEAYDLSISNMAMTDRLVVADRCAMLGRSAAQLAHEMGNQLCMLPLLELIEDEYGDHEDLVRMAGFARTTHDRLVQMINEVKAFVRFEHEQVVTQPRADLGSGPRTA